MGLFDFFKNKNKKTFYLGTAFTHPVVTFDIQKNTATFFSGITTYQVFQTDQITALNIESLGFGKMAVVVQINGITAYKAEGSSVSSESVMGCMNFIKQLQNSKAS